MIDLHTHTFFSDGELLPSELVRRAEAKGYSAIAITDHVDRSNIDLVLPRIVKVCRSLNKFWKIRSIPGVEITHVPLQEIKGLVKFARKNSAGIVIVHGQTVSEPVLSGTNRCAIEAGCDILAHPGLITREEVILAKSKNVHLEITTRKGHCVTNKRLIGLARSVGARLVLNNDAHDSEDLISYDEAMRFLKNMGLDEKEALSIIYNSKRIVEQVLKRVG